MRKNYQGKPRKSKGKFKVLGRKEVSVQVPLPRVDVCELDATRSSVGDVGLQLKHSRGLLSLRPALYAAGSGEVRFRNFQYRAL